MGFFERADALPFRRLDLMNLFTLSEVGVVQLLQEQTGGEGVRGSSQRRGKQTGSSRGKGTHHVREALRSRDGIELLQHLLFIHRHLHKLRFFKDPSSALFCKEKEGATYLFVPQS